MLTIKNLDSVAALQTLETGSTQLVVTSPPYDNLRTYGGHKWDFEGTARELFRVMCEGGIVCWNVNDAVVDGPETLTSFRQALYFKDVCGFRVHDTMIYEKSNGSKPDPWRYNPCMEYILFSPRVARAVSTQSKINATSRPVSPASVSTPCAKRMAA